MECPLSSHLERRMVGELPDKEIFEKGESKDTKKELDPNYRRLKKLVAKQQRQRRDHGSLDISKKSKVTEV